MANTVDSNTIYEKASNLSRLEATRCAYAAGVREGENITLETIQKEKLKPLENLFETEDAQQEQIEKQDKVERDDFNKALAIVNSFVDRVALQFGTQQKETEQLLSGPDLPELPIVKLDIEQIEESQIPDKFL